MNLVTPKVVDKLELLFTCQFVKHFNLTLSVQQSVTKRIARIAINLVTLKAVINIELMFIGSFFKHLTQILAVQ
jgi:hypothetical protein